MRNLEATSDAIPDPANEPPARSRVDLFCLPRSVRNGMARDAATAARSVGFEIARFRSREATAARSRGRQPTEKWPKRHRSREAAAAHMVSSFAFAPSRFTFLRCLICGLTPAATCFRPSGAGNLLPMPPFRGHQLLSDPFHSCLRGRDPPRAHHVLFLPTTALLH